MTGYPAPADDRNEIKRHDGVPIDCLPLTIGEARVRLLELIPKEMIGIATKTAHSEECREAVAEEIVR